MSPTIDRPSIFLKPLRRDGPAFELRSAFRQAPENGDIEIMEQVLRFAISRPFRLMGRRGVTLNGCVLSRRYRQAEARLDRVEIASQRQVDGFVVPHRKSPMAQP